MLGAEVRSYSVRVFRAPLKRPFVTALGRKTETCNIGFTLTLRCGARGYGEASASLALAHLEPARLARTLAGLGRAAVGQDASCLRPLVERAWKKHGDQGPAASAFECALLDAWTRSRGLSLAAWFGGRLKSVESDITISDWADTELSREAAREAAREGFRVLKVKVGRCPERALERLRLISRAVGRARPSLVLDGNQGLSAESALRLVGSCLKERMKVLLLEQPLPKDDFKGMAALARRSPVPLAADEMVHSPQDAVKVVEIGAASVINIKVAKSGLLRSLDIAAVARAGGLGLMIGCMAETSRGLMPSVHLALGTGFFSYVDLDSDHLLCRHAASADWLRQGPMLSLP